MIWLNLCVLLSLAFILEALVSLISIKRVFKQPGRPFHNFQQVWHAVKGKFTTRGMVSWIIEYFDICQCIRCDRYCNNALQIAQFAPMCEECYSLMYLLAYSFQGTTMGNTCTNVEYSIIG